MNPAHAALVAGALREKRFVDVEVRATAGDAWRVVRGEEGRGSGVQRFEGMISQFAEDADTVTLMVQDFPGGAAARPREGWQVRLSDLRIRPLAGPAEIADRAGLLLRAPLGPAF